LRDRCRLRRVERHRLGRRRNREPHRRDDSARTYSLASGPGRDANGFAALVESVSFLGEQSECQVVANGVTLRLPRRLIDEDAGWRRGLGRVAGGRVQRDLRRRRLTIATTIAGSLPKPAWLAQTERLWPQWQLEGVALEEAKRMRPSWPSPNKRAPGSTSSPTASSRAGTSCTDFRIARRDRLHQTIVPRAFAPTVIRPTFRPSRRPCAARGPCTSRRRFARGLTDRRLKVTLPVRDDRRHAARRPLWDRKKAAFAFAAAIRAEIEELAAAGVDVVQLDEPALQRVLRRT